MSRTVILSAAKDLLLYAKKSRFFGLRPPNDKSCGSSQRAVRKRRGAPDRRRRYKLRGPGPRLPCADRERLARVFEDFDLLLAPCVPGEAPASLESTGDPRLQRLWTALHVPALILPTHQGPGGLPVGIQLVAPMLGDFRL